MAVNLSDYLSNDYDILDKLSNGYDILEILSNDYDIFDKLSNDYDKLDTLQHTRSNFGWKKTPLPAILLWPPGQAATARQVAAGNMHRISGEGQI